MKKIAVLVLSMFLASCAIPWKNPYYRRVKPAPYIGSETSLDGQLTSLANDVAMQVARSGYRRVGLTGFSTIDGHKRSFEKYLGVEFLYRMIRAGRAGRFMVSSPEEFERFNQKTLRAMLEDGETIDSSMREIMREYKIDSFLIGSTVDFPDRVKVSVKFVSLTSGSVLGASSIMINKDHNVMSLFDEFGQRTVGFNSGYRGGYSSGGRAGEVFRTTENQYITLIPNEFVLYLKQINFQYNLYAEGDSHVELFLNEEYRVMKIDDMISLNYDDERYILSLRDIVGRTAIFTFARLGAKPSESTETFSWSNREPYMETFAPPEEESPAEGKTTQKPTGETDKTEEEKTAA